MQAALAVKDHLCAELEANKLDAQAEIASLQDQLKQVQNSYEALKESGQAQAAAKEAEETQGEAGADLRESLATAQRRLEEAQRDIAELQAAAPDKSAEIGVLKKQLEAASARADGHYEALQEINQQIQVSVVLKHM